MDNRSRLAATLYRFVPFKAQGNSIVDGRPCVVFTPSGKLSKCCTSSFSLMLFVGNDLDEERQLHYYCSKLQLKSVSYFHGC